MCAYKHFEIFKHIEIARIDTHTVQVYMYSHIFMINTFIYTSTHPGTNLEPNLINE